MKLHNIFSQIKTLPKKAKSFLLVLFAIVLPLVGVAHAQTSQILMEGWTKSLNVTSGETDYKESTDAIVDDVVQVQLWYHNREAPNGPVAKNTRVKFDVPTAQGKVQKITGTSSADNANTIVDDTTVNLSLDRARLDYIEGSAKWRYNKGAMDGDASCNTGMDFPPERCYATVAISDDVINSPQGVNLGDSPGCNAFHATVTIQVRVVADVVSVNKFVRHAGQGAADWKTDTTAKPGDNLEYLIQFKNEGNTRLEDVAVGDNLPKYNSYVNGSTNLRNGAFPDGTKITSDNITKGGIDVGHYQPGAVGYVWFTAKLDPVTAYEKCGEYEVVNVGVVRPKGMNEFYNTAKVKINVECDEEQEQPDFRCVSLTQKSLGARKYQFTTATAQTNATVKHYLYQVNGPNNYTFESVQTSNQFEHDFPATPGEYEIRVTVTFNVEGQGEKTATSDACRTTITIPREDQKCPKNPSLPMGHPDCDKVPPTTPPSGKLPSTGPGEMIGLFVATTVAGTLAHKFVLGRRYQ